MKAKIYNQKGKEVRNIDLPAYFDLPWNGDLVHQVAVSMMSNERAGTAQARGRGDVRGGGKKPWRQKGTGRARHGSTRSPIWVGGGVTHGPTKEKVYKKKINKKAKAKAFFTVLSSKAKKNQILFVDSLETGGKTKSAKEAVMAWSKIPGFEKLSRTRKEVALLAMPTDDKSVIKSFTNLPSVGLEPIKMMSTIKALNHEYIIIVNPEESLKLLSARK
jgi:large subunit ribosomal protein L4